MSIPTFLSADAVVEKPVQDLENDNDLLTSGPARVLLFNDDIHTFDEVIGQLIKATGCDTVRAEALAWEVHTKGKANVFEGSMRECLRVSGVLEEIGLHTQIEV